METTAKNLYESTLYDNGIVDILFPANNKKVCDSQQGRITFQKDSECIYGTLQFPINLKEDGNPDGDIFEEITFSLYKEMMEFISGHPGYQFVRIWNYVPLIVENLDQSAPDTEVYRCFNAGRYKAFEVRYGEDMQNWKIPAASAVGALDNILAIEFFASTAPSLFFENKVQIPAYQYSLKYGKLPPVFARGAISELKDETLLFISGTASVVSEDTVFVGDICGQIKQTFDNITTLINRSNLQQYGLNYEFGIEDLIFLRVYYKNTKDKEIIEHEIKKTIPSSCRVTHVNTDICRKELAIEIEGICRKKQIKALNNSYSNQ